jgi:hypothetical protein
MVTSKQIQNLNKGKVIERKQVVYNTPRKVFVEEYLTNKGKRLLAEGADRGLVYSLYAKNRYRINPDAKPIKTITHYKVAN